MAFAKRSQKVGFQPRLIQRMLANSARSGAHVLDPFAGSGSTLISCEGLRLHGHMIKPDKRFVDVQVARWQNLTGRKAAHAASGVPFDEAGGARIGAA